MISIIIPAYNVENYIETSINSVLNQTYKNIEVIVINDGSTDNTRQILNRFEGKDNRLKIIHKENTGVSDTRNQGIEMATGDYIGFIDSDDEIMPNMYEILYLNIKKYNADISHCGFELRNKNFSKNFNGTGNIHIQSQKEALVSLLKGDLFEPAIWNKLYRRKMLENVKFDKRVKFNEDLLFNVDAFKNAKKVVFHDLPLYKYIHNPLSASRSTQSYEIQKSVLIVAEELYEKLEGADIEQARNQVYVNKLITIYRAFLDNNQSNFSLERNVNKLLKKSSNRYLEIRTMYLKYSLLYFPILYKMSRLIYDKTIGRNKKWEIPS